MARGIRRWVSGFALLLLAVGLHSAALNRGATLTGKVTDLNGRPLGHATVLVYHAGVRTGYSAFCPSCYRDCGKRAVTDASGKFKIEGLSRDLWFELLVVHDGFVPEFMKKVDPLNDSAATAVLRVRSPIDSAYSVVRGQVEDTFGAPMPDAAVTPFAIQAGAKSIYGGTAPGLDPIAVTNEKGFFELAYAGSASKMALMVEARGMAPKFVILPTGAERQKVVVSMGALVRGRVIKGGKPIAGIEIGLSPREAWSGGGNLDIKGSAYDEIRIGTREDGSFAIPNVPAPENWELFPTMESSAATGSAAPIAVATARDKQEVNVGDLQIKDGYYLRGRLTPSDGKAIPIGTRIYIERTSTRDTQSANLSPNGAFQFDGLAAGDYTIWADVRGYKALDDDRTLKVSVSRDIDALNAILEPKASQAGR
jgi:hypothetical protein